MVKKSHPVRPRRSLVWIALVSAATVIACGASPNVSGRELHRGSVLLVIQTEREIVAENLSQSPVTVRISWDDLDPWGVGGADSFIDNWVLSQKRVARPFKAHISVQIWAWGTSRSLVDSCDLPLDR